MSKLAELFYEVGKSNALKLREEAPTMDGTQLIDNEYAIPMWDAQKDYSSWPVGAPVADEGQVWTLIQPHNAAHYAGRPSTLRALWGLAHTKNPARAKAWVTPYGTSGMYMPDECYKDETGRVWRCLQDNMVYRADELPDAWEEVFF